MTDAAAARDIAQKRQRLEREAQHRRTGRVKTLEDFNGRPGRGRRGALRIIIKDGSGRPGGGPGGRAGPALDARGESRSSAPRRGGDHRFGCAARQGLERHHHLLHVRPDSNARASAEREKVEIRTYRIISKRSKK